MYPLQTDGHSQGDLTGLFDGVLDEIHQYANVHPGKFLRFSGSSMQQTAGRLRSSNHSHRTKPKSLASGSIGLRVGPADFDDKVSMSVAEPSANLPYCRASNRDCARNSLYNCFLLLIGAPVPDELKLFIESKLSSSGTDTLRNVVTAFSCAPVTLRRRLLIKKAKGTQLEQWNAAFNNSGGVILLEVSGHCVTITGSYVVDPDESNPVIYSTARLSEFLVGADWREMTSVYQVCVV